MTQAFSTGLLNYEREAPSSGVLQLRISHSLNLKPFSNRQSQCFTSKDDKLKAGQTREGIQKLNSRVGWATLFYSQFLAL